MAGSKLTSFGIRLVLICVITSCSSAIQEDVYCPEHTRHIYHKNRPYRACQPYLCIPRDPDAIPLQWICPDPNQIYRFQVKILSPSCHWVRLHRQSYNFSSNCDGSITELETNVTHRVGEYVYHPLLKEAYICREHLLADDDTEDINLWCSSHTIHITEYPNLLNYTNDIKGQLLSDLNLPNSNLTVPFGSYEFHLDHQKYEVNVCLKLSLEFMLCKLTVILEHSVTQFELLSNLSLLVNWKKPIVYPVGHYYLSADNESAIVCIETGKQLPDFNYYTYPLYIVSAVFLLLTMLVYLFYPKLNYHAEALLCCIVSMMVMYICLTFKAHHYRPRTAAGRFLLLGFYYVSSMSTYLWLSVLSYELWKVFTKPLRSVNVNDNTEKLWFAMKCVYAWGIPLVIYFLIMGLSHDRTAAEYLGLRLVNGPHSFIKTKAGLLIFIYGPLIVILMVNMVFCGLTIWSIHLAMRDRRNILNKKDSLKLLNLSVKFIVIMGISWAADVISFLVDESTPAFYVSNVINSLQGVAIFVVYVCKKSTWKEIRKRNIATVYASSVTRSTMVSYKV